MGKMPAMLKMARQMNHASWLWRALFHRAINFHIPSQIARKMITTINTTSRGPFILVRWHWLFRSFDEITGGLPLAIFFLHERNGFDRGFFVGERSFKLHDDILAGGCARQLCCCVR